MKKRKKVEITDTKTALVKLNSEEDSLFDASNTKRSLMTKISLPKNSKGKTEQETNNKAKEGKAKNLIGRRTSIAVRRPNKLNMNVKTEMT